MIRKYTKVINSHGRLLSKYERDVIESGSFPQFLNLIENQITSHKDKFAIFSDSVVYSFVKKMDLIQLLYQHLFNNLIKVKINFIN